MKNKIIAFSTCFVSCIFFVLAFIFPILSTEKNIWIVSFDYEEVKLFDTVTLFWKDKDYYLAIIILLFVIILPIIKYTTLILSLLNNHFFKKYNHYISSADKWNMLDVFLVAILLVNFKLNSNIMVMELKSGTLFVTISVLFRIIASIYTNKYLKNK